MIADRPAYSAWTTLFLATLVQSSVSMLQQTPAALGPLLARGFLSSTTQVGLLTSAIVGGMALTTFLMGILIDRLGERLIVSLATASMALLALVSAFTVSYAALFSLFLLAGCAAAASTPGGSKVVSSWFPREKRGLATGIRQTGVPLGGIIAVVALLPIGQVWGWRTALLSGALGTLACALAFATLYKKSGASNRDESVQTQRRIPPEPQATSLREQLRNVRPFLKKRTFVGATIYSFVLVGAQWAATAYFALALHQQAHLSVALSGSMLAIMQIGGVVGRVAWGSIADALGRYRPAMITIVIIGIIGCLALSFIDAKTPITLLVVLSATLGLSILSWQGLYIAVIAEVSGSVSAATLAGAGLTVTYAGSLILPALFGLTVDLSNSYSVLWLVLAAWISVALIFGTMIKERP